MQRTDRAKRQVLRGCDSDTCHLATLGMSGQAINLPQSFGEQRPRGLENRSYNEDTSQANLQVMPVKEVAERLEIFMILKTNSLSIGQQEKSGETGTVQAHLQPIPRRSDQLLARGK